MSRAREIRDLRESYGIGDVDEQMRLFVGVDEHTCHADGCSTIVPPKMLMCRRHWRMVPRQWQQLLWDVYVPGQEVRKDPTPAYLAAAERCICAVAVIEERMTRDQARERVARIERLSA